MQIKNAKDQELFKEMITASDRAAAIVITSYLDDRLKQSILVNLRDDKHEAKRLFKPTGALGSFGNKIVLGYLMNLYSDQFRKDLEVYAGIRNIFAHWAEPVDFGIPEIRTEVEKIGFFNRMFPDMPKPETPPYSQKYARYVFTSNADGMAGQLQAIADDPNHPRIL